MSGLVSNKLVWHKPIAYQYLLGTGEERADDEHDDDDGDFAPESDEVGDAQERDDDEESLGRPQVG